MSVSYGGDSITFADGSTIASGFTGFKNRIINGAMVIDQRNAGASVTASADGYCLDRWKTYLAGGGVMTAQQVSTSPAGFINSALFTVTTADSSIAAGDAYGVQQIVEGLNFADLGWGTANAQAITISFWVRSSVTGTYTVSVRNSSDARSYLATYAINTANTFEQKTITIAGDTTGTWLTTNGVGARLWFDFGAGSTYTGSAGAWSAGTLTHAAGSTNWIATNGATFYITGVQLERGSTASSFEYRPYGTELALCQRYFWMIATGNNKSVGSAYYYNTTTVHMTIQYPVTMRTVPTLYQSTGTGYYTFERNGGSDTFNSLSLGSSTTDVASIPFNNTEVSGTAGQAGNVFLSNASAYVGLSAEL